MNMTSSCTLGSPSRLQPAQRSSCGVSSQQHCGEIRSSRKTFLLLVRALQKLPIFVTFLGLPKIDIDIDNIDIEALLLRSHFSNRDQPPLKWRRLSRKRFGALQSIRASFLEKTEKQKAKAKLFALIFN